MIQDVESALLLVADPTTILVVVLSAVFGLVIGALPGMTATLAAALLVPFTFFLDPVPAIAAIITMSAMAIFAGDIPSALLRIPGTPSSAAYTEDAFALTRNGKGTIGLGISLVASVLGGLFGSVLLIFVSPILGEFALRFTSYEYFWVAVLGLTAAVIVSKGSQLKGGIALMAGLLVSTVGLDVTLGHPRFTFGQEQLYRGVDFIAAMIGLFGLSEVLRAVTARRGDSMPIPKMEGRGTIRPTLRGIWRNRARVGSGSVIGGVVGALPGAGADIAAWIAYAVTRSTSRVRPGRGRSEKEAADDQRIEAISGASSANNAGIASAYVPTLAFGIPGDTITAILIGVLLVKGITPGPDLFLYQTDTLYSLYIIFIVANLLLLPLGFLLIRVSGMVLRIPRSILMGLIVAISICGAFAINNGYLEIGLMVLFGVMGYLFEKGGIPLAPVVLGIVLGPIVERNFMQSVIKTNWDLTQFFTRPISAVLIVLVVLAIASVPLMGWLGRRAERAVSRQGAEGRTPAGA
ncbi:tripartite tricarboxylate transporter permease [Brachybacterium sp. EE-P12]|uniref:Tripartite tricarboxylate transporter permease n=1 Tax=Candidatus Brachybacterium intestinipullorum TaxID=2838512 RepID=A0A9D2Q2U6_9MICO|nr:tripartite tricarboxylate transporter permease [Brachybacterium sp. EE-P12]HJC70883.1 tripartite tricarboxylate transporter permease [Candidatus Brachybacterium intestinipullorum]